MLKEFFERFRDRHSDEDKEYTKQMATAALLSEVIRADRDEDPREVEAYETMLKEQFSLHPSELEVLVREGRESAEDAVDLVQFTHVINDKCSNDEKYDILTALWKIAYADNTIAPIEEHTIRRIADLLYIPHSHFIKAKLLVTET